MGKPSLVGTCQNGIDSIDCQQTRQLLRPMMMSISATHSLRYPMSRSIMTTGQTEESARASHRSHGSNCRDSELGRTSPNTLTRCLKRFARRDRHCMVLEENVIIQKLRPSSHTAAERRGFAMHHQLAITQRAQDRRAMLSWPRSLRINGEPAEVAEVVSRNCSWMAQNYMHKLFINSEPGTLARGHLREVIRQWPNQTGVTSKGKVIRRGWPRRDRRAIANLLTNVRKLASRS